MAELTTKYGRFLDTGKRLLRRYGVSVQYGIYEPELTGQAVDEDNRVEQTYTVNVLFDNEVLRRQSGTLMPEDMTGCIMEAGLPFDPKPDDFLTTPQGRRYGVASVTEVAPDGVPLFYEVVLEDG